MNDRIVNPQKLLALYSFLAVAATVAATKALVWPRWPVARPLDEKAITKALKNGGFNAYALKPLAAKRNSELATSAVIGYSLGNGLELRLARSTARKRFNFESAFLTSLHPELQLKSRFLPADLPHSANGLIQNHPARQTCLVEGNRSKKAFGVTFEQLPALVDQVNKTKWSNIKTILGLQPIRDYQCILIQATTSKSPITIDQPTWSRILSVVRAALPSQSNKPSIHAQL